MLSCICFCSTTSKLLLLFCFLGTWDVTVTTHGFSDNGVNPKLVLTVCDDKGMSASVFIPKGSFKRAETYQASLELNKKFSTICKVRLEAEDTDGETWHCREVKHKYAFTQMLLGEILLYIIYHCVSRNNL